MNPLTKAELQLKHAQLNHEAEKLREQQRHTSAASPRALPLAKQIKLLQERADDYGRLLEAVES